jgi:antirestriction protein
VRGAESGSQPPGPWQPPEQVGDIYQIEVGPDGELEQAERLADNPRIWVGSWADYNNGTLHGVWLNAAQDEAELQAGIDAMLAASPLTAATGEPAEEWAIFDYDGFAPLRIDEHENLSWISRVAKGITEHGPAFAAYADVMEDEELLTGFDVDYIGHYDSLHAYVEQLINDLGYDRILDEQLPASIRPYVKIDITATARDLELGGDLHTVPASDGGVWIFHG